MKPIIPFALLGALLAVGAADAAATDPVGYITHNIAGGTVASPGFTFVSSTLVNADAFAGASTNNPSGTAVISAAGLPAGLDSSYYVEISSGASEGWWSTVVSVAGTDVTVADNFPAGLAVGTTFTIRKHQTLKGLLGSNAPGLDTGLSLDDADEVQLLNPATQVAAAYFYAVVADGAPADGWYSAAGNPSDNVVIEPGSSALVKRKFGAAKTFTSSGSVKVTKTQVDIFPGDNWVSTMRATGVTIGAMNLDTGNTATGVQRGVDLSVDELQITGLDQITKAFFAADPVLAPGFSGWYDGGGNDSNATLLLEDQGALVKRKLASPAIWTVPAQPIAP